MAATLREEIHKRDPFSCREQEAYLNLVRTVQHLSRFEEQFLRQFGLTGPQYNVLRILRGLGGEGATCSTIREHMISRVPDITRLIDRLERAGLVVRRRVNHDRRVVLVQVTEGALSLLAKMDEPLLAMHRSQLGHLSPRELSQLNRLLEKARNSQVPREPAQKRASSTIA